MSPAEHGQVADLRNIYLDLATVLGSAHHQAALEGSSPDRVAVVNQAVQRLWATERARAAGQSADDPAVRRRRTADVVSGPDAEPWERRLQRRWRRNAVLLDVP